MENKHNESSGIDPSDIESNPAFIRAVEEAETYPENPSKLKKLVEKATARTKTVPKGTFAETWAYLMTMLRMLRAYYKGNYRKMPKRSLVLIVVAIIYFVSPIDFIPDFIPFAGFLDDAFVFSSVLKSVKGHLDDFMHWETEQ